MRSTAPWPLRARLELAPRALARSPRAVQAGTAVGSAERGRRQVVALVFAIYLLAIFEGALRKWALPQFSQYLFFVRDPLLLVAYALAWQHGLWPRRQPLFTAALWMAVLGVALGAAQAASGPPSELRLLLGVYGWRAYFLYVPLAFLVGQTFQARDLQRLYALTLFLALPIGLLVAAQFFSPPGAAINVGSAADEDLQFRGLAATAERTRPMGPFASGAGQQQFAATACAIALLAFLTPRRLPQPPWWLLAGGAAGVLTALALSGSRGTVLQAGLCLAFAVLLGLLGRGAALKTRALVWPLTLSVLSLALYPLVFPEGFAAFVERWTVADAAESRHFEWGVFGRAAYGLIDFGRLLGEVPLLGWGLGYGGNASITLDAVIDGVRPGQLAETDFARHMVDIGPLAGLGYITFRLLLAGWLAMQVLRTLKLSDDPAPMLLFSYVGYVLVLGQITGQGAINVYGWLFAGLLIAACRQAPPRHPRHGKPGRPPLQRGPWPRRKLQR
ncbi:hypothetical protein IP87_00305 [beta proteobacterium AAP121]|nr:hypothetical protein IP80_13250 [beta proteobacterium AAP65]KPG01110.1 hypothetical protein IP87_00305 [beta proteobacterium AAP121]